MIPLFVSCDDTLRVTEAGIYAAIIFDSLGCSTLCNAVDILESTDTVLNITGDTIICQGDITTLTATGGFEGYFWYQDDQLLTVTDSIIQVSEEGVYTVTTYGENCCSLEESITVAFSIPDPIELEDASICPGTCTDFTVTGDFVSYEWFLLGNPTVIGTNVTFTACDSGNYVVVGTNIEGCTSSDTVRVDLLDAPDASFTVDTVCVGAESCFIAEQSAGEHIWSITVNGNVIDVMEPEFCFPLPEGTWPVTHYVNGICGSDTVSDIAVVLPKPTGNIKVLPGSSFCYGGSVLLDINGEGFDSVLWLPEGIILPADQTYEVQDPMDADHRILTIQAVLLGNIGCVDTVKEDLCFLPEFSVEIVDEQGVEITDEIDVCLDGTANVFYNFSGGNGAIDFFTNGQPQANEAIQVDPTMDFVYVQLIDESGCTAVDTADVNAVVINFSPTSVESNTVGLPVGIDACEGEENIIVSLNNTEPNFTYTWYRGTNFSNAVFIGEGASITTDAICNANLNRTDWCTMRYFIVATDNETGCSNSRAYQMRLSRTCNNPNGRIGRAVTLSPVPTKTQLIVNHNYFDAQKMVIRLVSLTGEELATYTVDPTRGKEIINVSTLPSGTYILYFNVF